jgi:uncharacterized cysteine cluster protein YcgN (CxxCxxCC family)
VQAERPNLETSLGRASRVAAIIGWPLRQYFISHPTSKDMPSNVPAKPADSTLPFWKTLALGEMSQAQWESLCDHCGRCCLHKIEDIDSGAVFYTNVVCRYMDADTCHCGCYAERSQRVPDCLVLTPDLLARLTWLPDTCAYRLLAEGKDLPGWHPLVSHDPHSVHTAGISVRGKVVPETCVHPDELVANIIHFDQVEPGR